MDTATLREARWPLDEADRRKFGAAIGDIIHRYGYGLPSELTQDQQTGVVLEEQTEEVTKRR